MSRLGKPGTSASSSLDSTVSLSQFLHLSLFILLSKVWGVGGSRGAAGGIGLGSGKTVFDGRELDEAVLEMAGKTMHGKEFRRKEHEYRDEG